MTDKQEIRLRTAFVADDAHVAVEISYSNYQRLTDAYEQSGRREGKSATYELLKSTRAGVP